MKAILFYFILINFSFAQDNLIKKDELFALKPFETSVAYFSPNISLKGFSFIKINLKQNLECRKVKRYELLFALFFSARFSLNNSWEDLLNKCQDYLLRKEKNLILSFFKNNKENRNSTVSEFDNIIESIREKPPEKFRDKKRILEKVEKMPKGILRSMVEGYLALKWNNKPWAHKEISKVVNTNFLKLAFEIDLRSEKEAKRLLKNITFLVNEILKVEEDKKITQLFLHYIEVQSESSLYKEIIEKKGLNWSLQQMRNLAKDYTTGIKNLGFWFYMLGKRAFKQEALTYLNDYFNDSYFKTNLSDYAWLLQYNRPSGPEFRAKLYKSVVDHHFKGGPYSQYLLIRLLEVQEIKDELIKRNRAYQRPTFIQKRNYFRNLIKRDKYLDFAIYQLYLLGDRDSKVFQSY